MPDFVRAIFIHCSNKNRNFLLYKKKAVNPKTNCFVCMDMKLSNWDLLISIPIKVSIYIRLSEQLADT